MRGEGPSGPSPGKPRVESRASRGRLGDPRTSRSTKRTTTRLQEATSGATGGRARKASSKAKSRHPLNQGGYVHEGGGIGRHARGYPAPYLGNMDEAAFRASKLHQAAVTRCIAVVGEAVGRLSRALRGEHQDIPWAKDTYRPTCSWPMQRRF